MKKYSLLCCCLLLLASLQAQKIVYDENAEVRTAKGFHAIKVSAGIELQLVQGDEEAVAVSAGSVADRDRIKTVVENGVLKIYYEHNVWKLFKMSNRKLKAYVSVINIDDIDVSSGAAVKVDGALKSNSLSIDVSSGARFKGRVDVQTLTVDHSSGAVMNVSGVAGRLSVDGSSGSVFHGYELATDHCNVDVSSGASAQVTVNKELTAEASSGGHISYKGDGVIRNVKTGSGGNVSRKS